MVEDSECSGGSSEARQPWIDLPDSFTSQKNKAEKRVAPTEPATTVVWREIPINTLLHATISRLGSNSMITCVFSNFAFPVCKTGRALRNTPKTPEQQQQQHTL